MPKRFVIVRDPTIDTELYDLYIGNEGRWEQAAYNYGDGWDVFTHDERQKCKRLPSGKTEELSKEEAAMILFQGALIRR